MTLHLVVANKTYSSWSFRPWIAMRAAGIPFEHTVVSLDAPDAKATILRWSGTGKLPVLIDGDVHVWESLAIIEYVAELFPAAGLWPADRAARAHARAISNEMHAGFTALRRHLPMNMARSVAPRAFAESKHAEAVAADVARIDTIWSTTRERFGVGGPYLFGTFTAADAMYAPVVSRFLTYAVETSEPARAYMAAITALPAWAEWRADALAETWVLAEDEPEWPNLLRGAPA